MIKQISKSNLLTTPFLAVKEWNFNSVSNNDLVLTEETSTEEYVALDYIDYYGNALLNRACNIALEQQEEDEAIYEEGINTTGFFFPDLDEKNDTGTYKRLLYDQVRLAFYNTYKNPVAIFGAENFDFHLSRMRRVFGESFRMFSFPQTIFGDSIRKESVIFYDNTLDDYAEIKDDGNGNLIATTNLFSRIQEVRKFGNNVQPGDASNGCPDYT